MKQLLFGIVLLTLMGCNRLKSEQSITSDEVIPRDSMIQILADIHIADAVSDQKFGADKSDRNFTNAMYERIFANHHVNTAKYRASQKYYESQPKQIDALYEQVITELSKREANLKKAK